MGEIKLYNGLSYSNIASVSVKTRELVIMDGFGYTKIIPLKLDNNPFSPNGDRLRVQGDHVTFSSVMVRNCAIIEGDIETLVVDNSCFIYGTVDHLTKGQGRVLDNMKEKYEENRAELFSKHIFEKRRKYIRLCGEFQTLEVEREGPCEVFLRHSHIKECTIGNSLSMKGNVGECSVSNHIHCSAINQYDGNCRIWRGEHYE